MFGVRHKKVSAAPDSDDATLIQPSDWNAEHEFYGELPGGLGGVAAMVCFSRAGGVVTIGAQRNVSSVTASGIGLYAVNFAVPLPDDKYVLSGLPYQWVENSVWVIMNYFNKTKAGFWLRISAVNSGEALADPPDVGVVVFR